LTSFTSKQNGGKIWDELKDEAGGDRRSKEFQTSGRLTVETAKQSAAKYGLGFNCRRRKRQKPVFLIRTQAAVF